MSWRNVQDVEIVAGILMPILRGYTASADDQHKIFHVQALKAPCRHLERFIAPEVSKKAQLEADKMGIGDLRVFNWNHQIKEMNDKGRKIFHWEHVYPVGSMVKALLELESPTLENVSVVVSRADIAWILKSEDKELSKNGYRSKRPIDPWEAYVKSGIEMLQFNGD